METATISNSKPPRKQLSEQLDRLDTILDALSEGLNSAVADAVREGTQLAVKYRDDTADKLAALVEAKLQNRPLPEPAEEEVTVLNLLDALKQSVAQVQQPQVPATSAAAVAGKKKRNSRRTA